jgi:hypothetical protein
MDPMKGPSKEWISKKSTKWKRTERKEPLPAEKEWFPSALSKLSKKINSSKDSPTKDNNKISNDLNLNIFLSYSKPIFVLYPTY